MTRVLSSCLLAAGVSVAAHAAHAQTVQTSRSWYVAAQGTASNIDEADQRIANAPVAGSTLVARNDMETASGWSLAVGRSFDALRVEIEAGRVDGQSDFYRISSPFQATVRQAGQVDISRAMLNAYFDFGPEAETLRPFVGLGAGLAQTSIVRIAGLAANPAAPAFRHIDDSSSSFGWQGIAGASVSLIPDRLLATVQYRYFDGGEFDARDSRGQSFVMDITAHAVDVGLRLEF